MPGSGDEGGMAAPILHKEPLVYDAIALKQRSYK